MRKITLSLAALLAITYVQAQTGNTGQTAEGNILLEINTGFGFPGGTSFYIRSGNDTEWNLGAEGGYFIIDNLAIKGGLGFGDTGSATIVSYKAGVKYYLLETFPLAADFTGLSIEDSDNPIFFGLQGGYAWFLTDLVSLEPGARFNISLNDDASDSIFELRLGVVFHL